MELIWQAVAAAIRLIVTLDSQVVDAAGRSLFVSGLAVLLATVVGLPLGTALARVPFLGRRTVVVLLRASMALPTVFLGMMCYAVFSRQGPLGPLDLLYTPWAIVCGEFLLALPLVVSLSHGAIVSLDARVAETAKTLGASPLRRWVTYISEARVGILLAVLTAFSRCVTELGIAMLVGGNLKSHTRTLATATALETNQGEFARAMAMGLILLMLAVGVTFVIVILSREEQSP